MTDKTQTIDEIIANRDSAQNAIAEADDALTDARQVILDGAAGRPLNAEELARVKKINEDMAALAAANTKLGFDTVAALNQSEQVKALADFLDAINKNLKRRQAAIAGTAQTIASFGNAMKQIDGVLQSILKLATLFA